MFGFTLTTIYRYSSAMVENKNLLDKVFPPGQNFMNKYCGLFRFRFYRLGQWFEVVIDDRLPTRSNHLIFLRGNQRNQFWPALFEKAYAKFNGGYSSIEGGKIVQQYILPFLIILYGYH